MNNTDKEILQILMHDARTPHAQIAERVGLSRPAVAERIKKLEQNGIIEGYSVVINPESVGRPITAFISARHIDIIDEKARAALKNLSQMNDVLELHSIAGEDCFLIKVRTGDINTLNTIVNDLKQPPLKMITKTTIVLESYFEKIGGTLLTPDNQQ